MSTEALFPTPCFVIREELLSENIEGFRRALDRLWPGSRLAYSVKTNSLPWILSWMKDRDVDAEVVSDEEYELALLCGFPDDRIVFNGPVKGRQTLLRAVSSGAVVNLDSRSDLETLVREKPAVAGRLGLRLNMNPDLFASEDVGYQQDGFRFGFSEETGASRTGKPSGSIFMSIRSPAPPGSTRPRPAMRPGW